MIGKILFYKEANGEGIIIGEDRAKYLFSVMDWDDFDTMPKVGLLIGFDIEENLAKNIIVKQIEQTTTQETVQNNSDETTSQQNITAQYIQTDTDNIHLSEKDLDKLSFIPLVPSYEIIINVYFEEAINVISTSDVNQDTKVLSYNLMRRFLSTAFNHLLDKDPTFINDELRELKSKLEKTYKIYKNLEELILYPEAKFDTVFLKKQQVFYKIYHKYENNKKRLTKLNVMSENLDMKIKELEKEYITLTARNSKYSEINIQLKKLKSKYVDTIDEICILKNQNEYFYNIQKDFTDKHRKDFVEYFKIKSEEIFVKFAYILNSCAYQFDYQMWELAKNSQGIKKFFIEANIDGSFSSKTFLKYFLKSLDEDKMNDTYKEMQDLLNYLEELEKGTILIVDDKSEMLPALKYFANHIDKYYKVKLLRPIDVLNELSQNNVHYIIVNIEIKELRIFDLVKKIKQVKKSLEFVFTSNKFTKELLAKAKLAGVKHFVATNVGDKILVETLDKIIDKKG